MIYRIERKVNQDYIIDASYDIPLFVVRNGFTDTILNNEVEIFYALNQVYQTSNYLQEGDIIETKFGSYIVKADFVARKVITEHSQIISREA